MLPSGDNYTRIKSKLRELNLSTVPLFPQALAPSLCVIPLQRLSVSLFPSVHLRHNIVLLFAASPGCVHIHV